ncbi:unnamed protein product [Protopolystoma xenopodis]|uniref:Actin-related protein 2/3 complex subunit 5 n=1 Tax=Protopolystoma xenopodis TaxID=117903 RepID=A0A448WFE7_9PLAT|nr:unnamed protein product [Protopolystoma xenopodis]
MGALTFLMAKNTNDTRFRKVDVDQFTESAFQDDQTDENSIPAIAESHINSLLANNRNNDALLFVLQNAPINSKDKAVKDAAARIMMKILSSYKLTQIDEAIATLNEEQIDLLMKYIYRGFDSLKDANSLTLLNWHEKVFQRGNLGCIIRVMTDRKRLTGYTRYRDYHTNVVTTLVVGVVYELKQVLGDTVFEEARLCKF